MSTQSSTLIDKPAPLNRQAVALVGISVLARLPLAMFSISLLICVRQLTGSFALAGLASGAYIVGRGISSPVLGRLVDRHGQPRVLVACATTSAVLLAAFAALPTHVPAALPVALSCAIGIASPPLSACVRTLLPVIVSDSSALNTVYTLETTALELTFIAGPPLALGLAAGISSRTPLLAGAILLLGTTALFAAQPASRQRRSRTSTPGPRAGTLHYPAVRTLILILSAVGIVFGAVDVAVADTASSMHDIAATGPLLGVWGVGSLLGGILCTRISSVNRSGAVTGLIIVFAAAHGTLILGSHNLLALGGLLLIAGGAISPATGAIYALAGRVVPSCVQTEAFAWLLSASATGASLGTAAAGVLAQAAGPQAAFALAAVAGGTAALAATIRRSTLHDELPDQPGVIPARS
jgi:MFS family permease